MTAEIIDGKALSAGLRAKVAKAVAVTRWPWWLFVVVADLAGDGI
ncbi:MAG: hypothetical protein V6Z86_10110 [Hyphomicrobiales bacterium]